MTRTAATAAPQRRISLLGPIDVRDGAGKPVAIGGPQQQRLLALLASEPDRVVSVGRMSEALWPDAPPADEVATLQTSVWRLRQAIGRDAVVASDRGYAMDSARVELDHLSFSRAITSGNDGTPADVLDELDAALGLWRGAPLGAFTDEWWARPFTERFQDLRLDALARTVDLLLQLGRPEDAAARSEVLVAADPLRESSVRRRMVALHRAGRAVDAVRAAGAFRRRLGEQVGLDPSPELDRLERHILGEGDAALDGRSIQGYVIGEVIADSSYGVVRRAHQPALRRDVAIKVVRAQVADEAGFVRRFEAEAQLVARLEHPAIVPLYDFWREPGAAYLVFRLLRGGTLRDRLASGDTFGIEQLDDLVTRVGGAIAAAHRDGIAHRDIRPENVVYDDDGHAYLADFGIAVDDDVDAAAADVVSFSRMVDAALDRVGGPAVIEPLRSVLRRAQLGESDAACLVRDWRLTRGATPSPPVPSRSGPTTAVRNPFKGLRPFTEADRLDFHGRDGLVSGLTERIERDRFVVVVGPSGCGKSSLIAAGLLPPLRVRGYAITSMVPGRHPMAALHAAWRRIATESQSKEAGDDPTAMTAALLGSGPPLLVVIDQLEELWTQSVPSERAQFVRLLSDSLASPLSQVRFVASVRADQYDRPLSDVHLASWVEQSSVAITPLDARGVEEAIVGPLDDTGVQLERGLLARIVDDVEDQPGALPLMQFALASMFDARSGARLTHADYDAIGGIAGALTSHAEQFYAALDAADQRELRRLFGMLVTAGDDADGDVRRRVGIGALSAAARRLANLMRAERLLTSDRDPATGEPTVEVAHEALFRAWPRLVAWIDTDRTALRVRRETERAAHEWERSHRDAAYLLSGSRLIDAVGVVDRETSSASAVELVAASESAAERTGAHERRRLRRTQMLLVLTAIALVAAMLTGTVALVQRGRAQEQADAAERATGAANRAAGDARTARLDAEDQAEQAQRAEAEANDAAASARLAAEDAGAARLEADLRRLAAEAAAVAPTQPDLALLLAVEASKRRPGPDSDAALLTALTAAPEIDRVLDVALPDGSSITQAIVSTAGPIVLATESDITVLDRESLDPTGVRWPIARAVSMALNDAGTELATVGPDGRVERRSLATGAAIGETILVTPTTVFSRANPLAYLEDGSLGVGNGPNIEIYAPGARSPAITVDLGGQVVTLVALPGSRRLLASVSSGPSPGSVIVDLADGSTRPAGDVLISGVLAGDRVIGVSSGAPNNVVAVDLASGEVARRSPPFVPVVYSVTPDADGGWIARTLFDELVVLDQDLQIVDRFWTQAKLIGRGPDGTLLGSLASRLVVYDADRLPLIATTLPISGPAVPDVVDDVIVAKLGDVTQRLRVPSLEPIAESAVRTGDVDAQAITSASSDGRWVVVRERALGSGVVGLYDTATGERLAGPLDEAALATISPDDTSLVTVGGGEVRLFDLPGLDLRWSRPTPGDFESGVSWSPDGRYLLVTMLGSGNWLFDSSTGATARMPGYWGAFVSSVELLLGGEYGPMVMYRLDPGDYERTFPMTRDVAQLTPLPGGHRVVRRATNGTLELFDLDIGRAIARPFTVGLDPLTLQSVTVAAASDGTFLLIGSNSAPVSSVVRFGPLIRIELDRDRWIELACAAVERTLTDAEWATYLSEIADPSPTCG